MLLEHDCIGILVLYKQLVVRLLPIKSTFVRTIIAIVTFCQVFVKNAHMIPMGIRDDIFNLFCLDIV